MKNSKALISIIMLILNINFNNLYSQNEYYNVKDYVKCENKVIIDGGNTLKTGDMVFIIQMNGATIDRSNTEKYGDILDFNGAGQYEFNEILDVVNSNEFVLKYKLKSGYDFSAVIQFIKVEKNINLNINQNPYSQAWNGKTGGVLVLYAEDSIILNSNIDISGKGFSGGSYYNSTNNFAQKEEKYYYPLNSNLSGNKGEGIANQELGYEAGKGKNANGGGGGNATNAGGGGGGNLSFGGLGGDPHLWDGGFYTKFENGLGGGITYFQDFPLIMGGGGGAGQSNNNVGTGGASGGGIVVIYTRVLTSNNYTITANGSTNPKIAGLDGAGGGGGGGSLLIIADIVTDNLKFNAIGGNGGSLNNKNESGTLASGCHGPGGGGSGGTLYLSKGFSNIEEKLTGGLPGVVLESTLSCRGTNYNAKSGEEGKKIIFEVAKEQELFEFKDYYFEIKEIVSCNSIKKYLSIKNLDTYEIVLWEDGSNENNFEITSTNKYKVTITNRNNCKFNLDTIVEINTNNISGIEILQKKNYKLWGDAKNYFDNNILLTENKSIKAGVVWCSEKLNVVDDFTTSFSFKVYNGNNNKMAEYSQPGADGFALIFQNYRIDNVGGIGGGIGYTGIPNSLAVELDLYGNYLSLDNIYDPNGNHLAVFSNKEKPNIANHQSNALIAEKDDIIEIMSDSTTYNLTLSYKLNDKKLEIKIDNNIISSTLTLENFDFSDFIKLDQNKYTYIGISSATGTAAQTHELLNWSICGELTDKITSVVDDYLVNNLDIDQFIYPNPVLDYLNFDNINNYNEIKIYNLIGNEIVNQKIFNQKEVKIDISEFEKGLYIYQLINEKTTIFSKFVKE